MILGRLPCYDPIITLGCCDTRRDNARKNRLWIPSLLASLSLFLVMNNGLCYNGFVATPILAGKGVLLIEYLITFLISVAAGVIANLISKWLDRDDNGNQPKD